MAKQDKRKSNKRGSQSQSTTKKTSESAKKKTDSTKKTSESAKKKTDSVITRGATSRSDSRSRRTDSRMERTDSRPTPSAGASRKRGNASQSLAATRKRKTTDSSTQHGSKRQKTRPLTTADIPAIVKAARDGLPEPTETSQDSDDLEDTQDTDVAISDSSDEFDFDKTLTGSQLEHVRELNSLRQTPDLSETEDQVKRIKQGIFVEMSELLPDHLGSADANVEKEDRHTNKTKLNEVNNIIDWIQCFGIYIAVLSRSTPERVADLVGYQSLIIYASHYQRAGRWVVYDGDSA
ncbi:protein FAM133-like [Dysidea avara]|uniref:protein FAM133-like n=1 Tax=Dysidea avara TaxID=196820 RepID=UPI003325F500